MRELFTCKTGRYQGVHEKVEVGYNELRGIGKEDLFVELRFPT